MVKYCRDCFFCIPNYRNVGRAFHFGTCYQAKRKVNANMTACALARERKSKMPVKSTPEKRNYYKDKDGNRIPGMVIKEVLGQPLTILAKREYRWGKYPGMAVKVRGEAGDLAIVEITADIPIKALNNSNFPKPPYDAVFVQKTSAGGNNYYTVVLDLPPEAEEGDLPY